MSRLESDELEILERATQILERLTEEGDR